MKNYYEILGLQKTASKDEIKRAYRRLAHQYHPDKNGGDEKKFKEINEAYQILGDERKKTQYDQFGSASGPGGGFSGFQGFDFNNFNFQGGSFGGADFGDIFSEFFGGGARTATKTRQKGRDIYVDVVISLEEAYSGTQRDISIKKYVQCDNCQGRKNEPGTNFKDCSSCGGSGETKHEQKTFLGAFTRVSECSACAGEGKIPDKKCAKCKGEGRVQDLSKITVKIPAGINSGEAIAFQGQGEVPKSGIAGDLYAQIHIKEHPQFKRERDNTYSETEISMSQAVLGDTIQAKTLAGEQEIKIPSGAESGDVIKLGSKGMPNLHGGGFGDHYLKIIVKTPKKISKKAREMFEALQKEGL